MKVIYYYQTFVGLEKVLENIEDVDVIIVSSIHFGQKDKQPYIHLNDNDPKDPMFENLWMETKKASVQGCKIMLMMGGAGKPEHFTKVQKRNPELRYNKFNLGELKEKYGCTIVGPLADHDRIAGIDIDVKDGDIYKFGDLEAKVFDTPGHTRGHIAYWFKQNSSLFCGDTLFALGCGRVFEGTFAQMWDSLGKLRELPDNTVVYCAHEYTQSNAKFAITIEKDNAALLERATEIDLLRAENKRTVPSLLGVEKATNPFLRADIPSVAEALGLSSEDPVQVFSEIRKRKDNF